MTNAQLALAAGEVSDSIGYLLRSAERERAWLDVILREIAQRAGVAPKSIADYDDPE